MMQTMRPDPVKPYLTDEEIREIASPLKQPAAISRWLSDQGFVIKRKPNGMPLVSRAHFESSLAQNGDGAADGARESGPDVVAFLKKYQRS